MYILEHSIYKHRNTIGYKCRSVHYSRFCPFLFLVYINDLPQQCDTCEVAKYADDTILSNAGYNCERHLEDGIDSLTAWFQKNLY